MIASSSKFCAVTSRVPASTHWRRRNSTHVLLLPRKTVRHLLSPFNPRLNLITTNGNWLSGAHYEATTYFLGFKGHSESKTGKANRPENPIKECSFYAKGQLHLRTGNEGSLATRSNIIPLVALNKTMDGSELWLTNMGVSQRVQYLLLIWDLDL